MSTPVSSSYYLRNCVISPCAVAPSFSSAPLLLNSIASSSAPAPAPAPEPITIASSSSSPSASALDNYFSELLDPDEACFFDKYSISFAEWKQIVDEAQVTGMPVPKQPVHLKHFPLSLLPQVPSAMQYFPVSLKYLSCDVPPQTISIESIHGLSTLFSFYPLRQTNIDKVFFGASNGARMLVVKPSTLKLVTPVPSFVVLVQGHAERHVLFDLEAILASGSNRLSSSSSSSSPSASSSSVPTSSTLYPSYHPYLDYAYPPCNYFHAPYTPYEPGPASD